MASNVRYSGNRSTKRPTATQTRRRKRKKKKDGGRFILYILMVALLAVVVLLLVNRGGKQTAVVLPIPTTTIAPTPEPTPVPTQAPATVPPAEPTPEPTPEPTEAPAVTSEYDFNYTVLDGVPQTDRELGVLRSAEMVGFDYFDDCVFVGDSVSLKLYQYVKKHRQNDASFMGKAQFLTSGSLGSGNALAKLTASNSVHPTYMGTKMLIEDAIARMKVGKVYIMLGMNDIALYGIDESVANLMTLCDRILAQSPNVEIYIQSATPRLKGDYGKLNNNNLFAYDLKLYEACAERGYHFVDVAYVMRDAEGNLPADHCSDPDGQALHFTDVACKKWIDYLRSHTVIDD